MQKNCEPHYFFHLQCRRLHLCPIEILLGPQERNCHTMKNHQNNQIFQFGIENIMAKKILRYFSHLLIFQKIKKKCSTTSCGPGTIGLFFFLKVFLNKFNLMVEEYLVNEISRSLHKNSSQADMKLFQLYFLKDQKSFPTILVLSCCQNSFSSLKFWSYSSTGLMVIGNVVQLVLLWLVHVPKLANKTAVRYLFSGEACTACWK